MTDEKEDLERKAFEEWYYEGVGDKRFPLDKYENGCYCNPEAENMFSAWCAAKNHAEKSKWISVKDRLPDAETTVLVCNERGEIFSSWASDVDVFWFYLEEDDNRVTHWQQLPEPPAEQSDAICRGDV